MRSLAEQNTRGGWVSCPAHILTVARRPETGLRSHRTGEPLVAGQCIKCPTIIYTSRARIAADLPIVLDRRRRIEAAKHRS